MTKSIDAAARTESQYRRSEMSIDSQNLISSHALSLSSLSMIRVSLFDTTQDVHTTHTMRVHACHQLTLSSNSKVFMLSSAYLVDSGALPLLKCPACAASTLH